MPTPLLTTPKILPPLLIGQEMTNTGFFVSEAISGFEMTFFPKKACLKYALLRDSYL